ncbi:MAG: glycosyltransferase family 4 protein [Anaerolineales bacterium]
MKFMLVAFNAHLLTGDASYRSAGISVYIANLLCHLARATEEGLDYAVLLGAGQLPPGCEMRTIRAARSTARPARRIAWEQTALPGVLRRLGADLLHAPAFVGPLVVPCPQIITLHDLSFLRHPQFFKRANRLYLRAMTPLACRRAAAVIAVSEFTAREAVALMGVAPERVHVITHGVDPRFRPLPPEEVARFRATQGLPERFILHMGTLEPRKNLVRLVQAFAQGAPSDVHLVLAGGRGWLYETIFAEVARWGVQDRVHFPGYVPAETQALWYNAADLFAYVSIYEGFGLPVLEALACGTPTVASATTSLPEAAGDAALTVPPDDVAAIAAGLARLLADDALRAELRARGLAHAARFSWETTAQRTAALYRQIVGGTER